MGIVKILVAQNGININLRSEKGHTPLHLAAHRGYAQIVQLLLDQSEIDAEAKSKDGHNFVDFAIGNNRHQLVK